MDKDKKNFVGSRGLATSYKRWKKKACDCWVGPVAYQTLLVFLNCFLVANFMVVMPPFVWQCFWLA